MASVLLLFKRLMGKFRHFHKTQLQQEWRKRTGGEGLGAQQEPQVDGWTEVTPGVPARPRRTASVPFSMS